MEQHTLAESQHSGKGSSEGQLHMVVTPDGLSRFIRLLSLGFLVNVKAGRSIQDLLSQDLGIEEEYIDKRIQTIFLNGKAVDDINSARISAGSSLALSAAMPGMVGSTFRKGGVFAGMRSQISYDSDPAEHHDGDVRVNLKLFNLVAKELGPDFLQRGVWLNGKHLHDFISENFDNLKQGCTSLIFDNEPIELNTLLKIDFSNKIVFLQLKKLP